MSRKGNGEIAELLRIVPRPGARATADAANGATMFSEEEVRSLIAEAAERRARRRGYSSGAQSEDWIEAEREILESLDPGRRGTKPPEPLDRKTALEQEGALLEVPPVDETGR